MGHPSQGESGAIIVMRTPHSENVERKPPIREAISIKILLSNIQALLYKWERMKGDSSRSRLYAAQDERAQIFYDQFGDESAVPALLTGSLHF